MADYLFPFQQLEDNELSKFLIEDGIMFDICYLDRKEFLNNSTDINRFLIDEDPDLNYINAVFQCNCKYYMEDKFISNFQNISNKLSIFHMNARSLVKHFFRD